MAKKKVVEHEVVFKTLARVQMTKEMVDWLVAHGKNLNDNIQYHDPLLVQCVKELQPEDFGVKVVKGNKYKVVMTLNDFLIMTPEDVKALNKDWVVFDDASETVVEPK